MQSRTARRRRGHRGNIGPACASTARHAQLTFAAYQGEGGMQLGEVIHRLEVEQGQYTVQTVTQTTGRPASSKATY